MNDLILESLRVQGLTPKKTLNGTIVSLRSGPQKRSVTLDMAALIDALPGGDPRAVAYNAARGIMAVVNEPSNSRGGDYSFIDTTPVIAPAAEGPGFVEGVTAAGGGTPFFQPYVADLRLAYYIDLEDGQRLLPQKQVDDWGVHPERVEKAGLSILFHRSAWEPWEKRIFDGVLIRRMHIGDGGDAARGTLLEMFDYEKSRAGMFFAMPTHGSFLCTNDTSEDARRVLENTVTKAYEQASDPLTRRLFLCERGKLSILPR